MPFDLSKLQAYTETKEKPEKSESWDDLIEAAFKTEPEKGIPQQVKPDSNLPVTSSGQTKNMPAASDSWDDLISAAFKNEPEVNTGSVLEATGLNDLKNRLADFDKSNQIFLNEWDAKEKELEEVKKSFDPTKVNAVLSYLHENGGKRKQLKQEREELLSSIYNHPELIAERKEKAAELEKRIAEMDKLYDGSNVPVLGTGPGAYMMKGKKEQEVEREADRFSRAYKLYENAHDMLLAPSKFDKSNAFLNFAKGAGNVLSDKDFWTGGMSAIARNLDLGSVFKKISENKEGKDFKDLLTPGESSLLDAYYAQVNAQAERAKDLSLGYQAGQGAAQSLEYMAEFLATGGLATAASSGAKKAAMKWVIKHSAPGSLKRQVLKGAAWGTEAGVGTLARTPLMPSTYVNVTDPTRQFETDEKGNVLQDEAGRPVLKSGWKIFREGVVDSFIENLSEVSGGHIAGTLGVGGKIVGKVVPQGVREAFAKTGNWLAKSKPGEMYKSLSKSPVWKFLKEGGYNGLLEEWGEEWYGAALRSVLTDPSALKDYATLENQLVTVASFLPMSVLGGGVATGQMLKAKGQYKQTLNALQGLMKDLGYKEEQVAYLTDQIEASDAEKMASTIAPLINTLAGENEEKAGELFTAVADFSRAKGNYHLMNGAYEERMAARKAVEDKRMEEETGGYVNSSTGRVEIVADEEGNTAYVAGESLDGDHKVYILNKGGEKISVSREDFEDVYKVQGSFDKDEFLGTIIMNRDLEEEISEEESRVEDAREIPSEDYTSKVDENTAEIFDSALDDGKYALLKDGRKGLIETTPEGLVADFLDGSRENITEDMIERPISDEEWLTAQQEEVQPEAEEVVSAISQETLPENVQQSKQIPVTDDGKPDYNAMSPEMFAEEFEKEFGPEETKAELEKMVTDVEAKIEKLHKKAPTDRNARAENKREILRLTKEKESVLQALERYATEEKVPEENVEVIADYSAEPEITEPEKVEVVNEEELKKEMPASSISGTNIEENSETGVELSPAEALQEADNYEKGQVKIDGYENEIVKPTADEVLFREKENYTPEEDIEEVNRRFNERLSQLEADKEQKDRVLRLGRAGEFLRNGGIADAEIELEFDKFVKKSAENYKNEHSFSASDIVDLPKAINAPIAVFDSTNGKDKVILTELKKDGDNFIVAIKAVKRKKKGGIVLEINEISTLYPKAARGIVNWINTGKAKNVDKKKTLHWLEALQNHLGTELTNEELSVATNIIQNFENPTFQSGEISSSNDDIRFRNIEEVNQRFNQELEQQIAGTLPKGHIYRLGRPGEALRSAGILDMDIEMPASRLQLKSSKDYRSDHPFDLSEVENLPQALQNPIAVFESETDPRRTVVLTELKNKNENFLAVLDVIRDNKRNEINSVISLYPKNSSVRVGKWFDSRNQKEIGRDLLKWVDKEKALKWLSSHSSNVNAARLSSKRIANIIQSFKNPTILEGEISAGIDQLSEELGVPVKKVQSRKDLPEGIQRQMKNGRYPGLFDPKAGEVYMVMDEITDVADAQATMLHEIVGHKGIRGLFGDKIGAFTQRVLDSMPENERELWVKKYNGNEQLAAEEYVARFAEGYENPGVWEKIKAIFRELFRDLGIDLKLSDNDLKYILWKAKNKLKEGDGMLEIAEKIAKDRSVARELWRKEEGGNSIEEVNRQFNEELERYKSGQMGKNDMFHLGKPRGILRGFLPDLDIIMFQRTVKKGIEKKHNVGIEAMLNMPSELCKPIFIFQRDDHTLGILTEMKDQDNRNVCVAIEMKKKVQDGKSFLEVNELTSFHGRRSENVIFPILKNNTLKWVDKEKGLDWISSVNPNESQEISNQDLSSATNIIQNFENPKLEDEIRFREITEEEGEKNKEAAERIDLLSELQSQLLNERVSAKLIARKLAGYARNAFGKDLVEVMGKKDFDMVVREIERGLLESKLPKESVELTDERKRLIQEYWKNLGDKDISGKAAKRIREIDQEVNRMAKEALWEPMMRIGDVVATLELKRQNERLNRLVNLQVDGRNAQGVSVAKKVDEETKVMLHFIREHVGEDMAGIIEELERKRDEAEVGTQRFDKKDEATLKAAMALQQFFAADNSHEVIKEYEARIKELKEGIKELEGQIDEEKQKENPDKRLLARLRRKVKNKKQEIRYSAFTVIDDRYKLSQKMIKLNDLVEEMIYEGRSSFLDRVNEESVRRTEILREAMRDMDTRTEEKVIEGKEISGNKFLANTRARLNNTLFAPAWSFNYTLKYLSKNAVTGEGELYNRIVRGKEGIQKASENYYTGLRHYNAILDMKAREIFKKPLYKVMKESERKLDLKLLINNGHAEEVWQPSIGEALSVVMWNKMADGAMKLRRQGVSEEDIAALKRELPGECLEWAEWIQEEFLPGMREKYNKKHVELFGSSMAQIDHYFPLKVQAADVYKPVDVSQSNDYNLPVGITGSIINRKPNYVLLDYNQNAFDLILRHGVEMEHWNAYSRVTKDLNGLVSNTAFRKMLNAKQKGMYDRFRATAAIALESYRVSGNDWILEIAKGATAAKISFRLNTALKQVLSYSAFACYSSNPRFHVLLVKNVLPLYWNKNFYWALENCPNLAERWKSRQMGDEKLKVVDDKKFWDKILSNTSKIGMLPNAFMDMITCANGAKTIYDYKLSEYKKRGYTEKVAHEKAKMDAVLAVNETQQSSSGLMMSELQMKRSLGSVAISLFNNSNFGYLRKALEGADELMRDIEKETESRKRVLIKDGMTEEQAERFARKDVLRAKGRAVLQLAVMGWGANMLWALGSNSWKYLWALFSDDDDAVDVKEEAREQALKYLWLAPLRNLWGGNMIEAGANGYNVSVELPLLGDINMLLDTYRRYADEDGILSGPVIYHTFRILTEIGTGVDLNTVTTLASGIANAVENGEVRTENVMEFLNAPLSQIDLITEREKEGETLEEYIERCAKASYLMRAFSGRGTMSATRRRKLTDRYRLTPFQRAKKEVKQDAKRKINQVNRNESLSPAEKKVKRESLRKERDEQMEKLEEKYEVVR